MVERTIIGEDPEEENKADEELIKQYCEILKNCYKHLNEHSNECTSRNLGTVIKSMGKILNTIESLNNFGKKAEKFNEAWKLYNDFIFEDEDCLEDNWDEYSTNLRDEIFAVIEWEINAGNLKRAAENVEIILDGIDDEISESPEYQSMTFKQLKKRLCRKGSQICYIIADNLNAEGKQIESQAAQKRGDELLKMKEEL